MIFYNKQLFLFNALMVLFFNGLAQSRVFTEEAFEHCENDSVFIDLYGSNKYQVYSLSESDVSTESDSILINAEVGYVYGPIQSGSEMVWYKVVDRDSVNEYKVGNIFFNPFKMDSNEISKIAKEIVENADREVSFDRYCKQYSGSSKKTKDCALDWFGPGVMVKDFEEAIKGRGKGEIFQVETAAFGIHVVKILENPRSSMKISFVKLAIPNLPQHAYDIMYRDSFRKQSKNIYLKGVGNFQFEVLDFKKENLEYVILKYPLEEFIQETNDEVAIALIEEFKSRVRANALIYKPININGYTGNRFYAPPTNNKQNILGLYLFVDDFLYIILSVYHDDSMHKQQLKYIDSFKVYRKS